MYVYDTGINRRQIVINCDIFNKSYRGAVEQRLIVNVMVVGSIPRRIYMFNYFHFPAVLDETWC